MINQEEVKRIAGALGVEPTVIDHDYVLGGFLYFLVQTENVRRSWIFKGGTALAKCYFPDYRFSEDLDFTCLTQITSETLLKIMDDTKKKMQHELGIATDVEKTKVETIDAHINHNFSDVYHLPFASIQVYALEETLVEKLRAVSAQRRFPIARDIFDLYSLSNKISDVKTIKSSFKKKCAIKGISVSNIDINNFISR